MIVSQDGQGVHDALCIAMMGSFSAEAGLTI